MINAREVAQDQGVLVMPAALKKRKLRRMSRKAYLACSRRKREVPPGNQRNQILLVLSGQLGECDGLQ